MSSFSQSPTRTKTTQVNLINKANTSKTIFTIAADTNIKRSLEVLTIDQPAKRPKSKQELISFSTEDLKGIETPHQDPLVISAILNDYTVHRILVDTGASIDILYWDTFENMSIKEKDLTVCHCPIKGFRQVKVLVVGNILYIISNIRRRQIYHNKKRHIHNSQVHFSL